MKIFVENLGTIRQAEMDLGKFTIICGKNNSGKTYITYALYGFLDFWKKKYKIQINKPLLEQLKQNGVLNISLTEYVQNAQMTIQDACKKYSKNLSMVYSAQEKLFENSSFSIKIDSDEIKVEDAIYKHTIHTTQTKAVVLSIKKDKGQNELTTTLFSENSNEEIPDFVVSAALSDAIKTVVFGNLFPNCFIASAERTGAAIFRNELNLARNRLLDKVLNKDADIDPLDFIRKEQLDYALPVEDNVDFTRNLARLSKRNSYLAKENEEVIDKFADILGGRYQVSKNDELYFMPKSSSIKLTMDESSSAVRSLLDIGFYLKHVANKNDLLIIDEPELNLHPENQRKIARLLSTLTNHGIRVFITTHSDYILKELSTLIMLNSDKEHIVQLAKREGYSNDEFLGVEDIKVYIAQNSTILLKGNTRRTKVPTLTIANIDSELGIEVSSFDDTINKMNIIQDEIIYGG